MAGRPLLRIGQHGKITRKYLSGGLWVARCRYRDRDGVTRIIEQRGPVDENEKHGKFAEDALIEELSQRRPPNGPDAISLETRSWASSWLSSRRRQAPYAIRTTSMHGGAKPAKQ